MYPERVWKALQRAKANIMGGTPADALGDLEKVLQKMPKAFDAWFLLGQANMLMNDPSGAERCFRKTTQLQPRSSESWTNLGMTYWVRNMYKEALPAYLRSASLSPGAPHPDIVEKIGACYLQMDLYHEAIDAFKGLLCMRDTGNTWLLLGMAYQGADMYPEALKSNLKAEEKGGYGYTLFLNIGSCYHFLHDPDNAAKYARKALDIQPGDAVGYYNFGIALADLGNLEEAVDAFSKSSLPIARSARAASFLYMDTADPMRVRRAHEECVADTILGDNELSPACPLAEGGKLRVGFVSHDFREHPVAFFLEGLLRHLNRDKLDLHCYADVRNPDYVTERLRAMGDTWRDIFGKSNKEFQAMVAEDRIHVLVDLGGHTNSDRLQAFGKRMAPVQATYLGYGATTGLRTMDYLLGDNVITPEGNEDHYSEKLLRLGSVFATYTPPTVDVPVSAPPMFTKGHPTFGSFAQLKKVSPSTVRLWVEAMKAVPNARFLMMAKGFANEPVINRFLAPFIDAGLDRERFDLRPHGKLEGYFAVHNEIDLILDSIPWNGHTTTLHALWMGVPTLTVKGKTQTSRFGELVMNAAGLHSFVVDAPEDFGQAAAHLLDTSDLFKLDRASMREVLLSSDLCDHAGLARRFETACETMFQNSSAA